MIHDLQKAGPWKRAAAWLFDLILMSVVAAGACFLLSGLLGYDGYSDTLDQTQARYEQQYGVALDISYETYQSMPEEKQKAYDDAYDAFIADEEALYAYNMMLSLTLVIISLGILAAMLLWEFFIPLWLGNGQTLGKKIFGMCLVRNDGVKVNNMQLFTRTILGKYTLETMIPVYVFLLMFWGSLGMTGSVILLVLALGQTACLLFTRNSAAIHDLLAGTAVVDMASQTIFRTTEDLIEYQKRLAADRAQRAQY
ncbi:MAG: RDD family protein [Oscillospiraceae bacterium]|nr:RDD family protein [Oscillospiraceae bacterium]